MEIITGLIGKRTQVKKGTSKPQSSGTPLGTLQEGQCGEPRGEPRSLAWCPMGSHSMVQASAREGCPWEGGPQRSSPSHTRSLAQTIS